MNSSKNWRKYCEMIFFYFRMYWTNFVLMFERIQFKFLSQQSKSTLLISQNNACSECTMKRLSIKCEEKQRNKQKVFVNRKGLYSGFERTIALRRFSNHNIKQSGDFSQKLQVTTVILTNSIQVLCTLINSFSRCSFSTPPKETE